MVLKKSYNHLFWILLKTCNLEWTWWKTLLNNIFLNQHVNQVYAFDARWLALCYITFVRNHLNIRYSLILNEVNKYQLLLMLHTRYLNVPAIKFKCRSNEIDNIKDNWILGLYISQIVHSWTFQGIENRCT